MIRMRILFGFTIMLIFAVGSCTECKKVDVIEGANASLPFTASGLTIFSEIDCEKRTVITRIGQYCGPADNCSTMNTTGVSIETGHLIVYNVTYNRCYSAKPDKKTPEKETCYNVTVNKLHSTISPETSTSKFTTETPNSTSTSYIVAAAVVCVCGVALILVAILYIRKKFFGVKQRYITVNAAQDSQEKIFMGTLNQ